MPDETRVPPAAPALPRYGAPLSLETARKVMAAAEAEAAANGWPMVIAIVDSGGHLTMLHRLDQSNQGAVVLAQRKAATAIRYRRATKVFEDLVVGGGAGARLMAVSDEIVPLEGGLPLIVNGEIVGAIGVSGMQSHQDGQVAAAGAKVVG